MTVIEEKIVFEYGPLFATLPQAVVLLQTGKKGATSSPLHELLMLRFPTTSSPTHSRATKRRCRATARNNQVTVYRRFHAHIGSVETCLPRRYRSHNKGAFSLGVWRSKAPGGDSLKK